jgi:hypothetical protein
LVLMKRLLQHGTGILPARQTLCHQAEI